MRFLPTVTALTGAALTGATPTGLPTAQLDLSKYNLSDCTETYLPYIARVMTGIEYDEERKYAYCVVTTSNDTFFDYKCLCRGGDGEGSAIMDKALLDGQVWLNCGWDYTFDVVFPETINFCRTLLKEDLVTATTRRSRRALKQPPPQPNIGLVAAEELPDTRVQAE
ncbi:hypothetical protein B0H65DRAFT_549336 [Neurospora tetraspora]|uniref:Uncharacterized protein n=1 Tax=Neurospora tetraspora TaxID=94610 RepID=A0AAE0JGE1_9PEZI|nr:hypothetical protein B0H65DRAFT_549336 [Neurospora tetraspora]